VLCFKQSQLHSVILNRTTATTDDKLIMAAYCTSRPRGIRISVLPHSIRLMLMLL